MAEIEPDGRKAAAFVPTPKARDDEISAALDLVATLQAAPRPIGRSLPTCDFVFVDDPVDAFVKAATVPGIGELTVHTPGGREIVMGDLRTMIGAPPTCLTRSEPTPAHAPRRQRGGTP